MAAEVPVAELAPPGTTVAIGINVHELLNSPLAKDFASQQQEFAAKFAGNGMPKGFDPLKDVDQVLILAAGAKPASPMVIILRGRFDTKQLAQGAKRYHNVPMVEGMGVISSDTLIVGNRADVQAAIDRIGSGAQMDAQLVSRMDAARERYDIWGIGDCPEGLPTPGEGTEALRSIDRFTFGAALREGLAVTAEFHAGSTEDAAKMSAALSLMEAALKMQQPKDSATKLDVHAEDGTFRISLAMPAEELRQAVEAQRTRLVSAMGKASGGNGAVDAAPEVALPPVEEPSTLPVLEAMTPPAPSVAVDPAPEVKQKAAVPPAPVKPEAKTVIVKAPNGDTLVVRLPGK
jgi:hypothetical protein